MQDLKKLGREILILEKTLKKDTYRDASTNDSRRGDFWAYPRGIERDGDKRRKTARDVVWHRPGALGKQPSQIEMV